jgi:hypothetical protein
LAKKRTPIERFIEVGTLEDRRHRWEEAQRQKGLYRVCVRCHVDDREKVKEFAAQLLRDRLSEDEAE